MASRRQNDRSGSNYDKKSDFSSPANPSSSPRSGFISIQREEIIEVEEIDASSAFSEKDFPARWWKVANPWE